MKVLLNGVLDKLRDGAWPSSARVVRCSVKSENERDLCFQLLFIFSKGKVKHNGRTAGVSQRKVQATVGLYASNLLGYTRHALVKTTGCNSERRSESLKLNLVQIEGCNSPS